jgi:hypothetical protein
MNDISLIGVDDIKELTSISKSISAELLEPYIIISEEYYVYPILGDALLTELKNQITGNTLSALNAILLNQYIRPLAAYGAWFEGAPFIQFKTVQKGIVKQSSDNSSNVDLSEFNVYRNSIKDKISFYEDRLAKYLDDNKSSYPLYRSNCNNNNNNSSGIYTGLY